MVNLTPEEFRESLKARNQPPPRRQPSIAPMILIMLAVPLTTFLMRMAMAGGGRTRGLGAGLFAVVPLTVMAAIFLVRRRASRPPE